MSRKLLIFCLASLLLTAYPMQARAVDSAELILDPNIKGAKILTPVLDLVSQELKDMSARLLDNAVFSMERLWKDTVEWNVIKPKTRV
ncbi:MAG TPA: hypothetical protein VHQ46_00060 [Desulfobacteria bacterium]|nr:hypothetical protein [Desulfobacteria bacterium]